MSTLMLEKDALAHVLLGDIVDVCGLSATSIKERVVSTSGSGYATTIQSGGEKRAVESHGTMEFLIRSDNGATGISRLGMGRKLGLNYESKNTMGRFLPVPGQSLYGASKAAVKLLTEGLYSELLSTNVRVTFIFPGAIGTDIASNSGVSIGAETREDGERRSSKPLEPAKAAEIIVNGIEQDRYRVLLGSDVTFMDRIYRLSPQRPAHFIFRQMQSLLPK